MIRVLIVAEIRLYREGLAAMLRAESEGIDVVATAAGADDAVRGLRELSPDIVLLDMAPDNAWLVRALEAAVPGTRVVALAVPENEREVLACAEAGVAGFVTRDASVEDVAVWGAFTDRHAVLRVRADRHEDHARELLGETTAIVTSDRWWAYSHLPLKRRQVCWAHLRRDFNAHAEGLAAEKAFGEHGLRICEELFWAWEIYQHTGDRRDLKLRVRALRRELKPILRTYAAKQARYRHTRGWRATCSRSGRRYGRSPSSAGSNRPTTTPNARSAARSSTASSASAPSPTTASDASSDCCRCTPPAACNADPCTPTSSTPSRPTTATTPSHC